MATATRRQAVKKSPKAPIVTWFRNFLAVKDEAAQLGERQATLRDRLIEEVAARGADDDKGNSWFELPEPVEFVDHKGKKFVYTDLKRERHLSPSKPTPDPDKSEVLLRKHKLWLTPEQEKAVQNLRVSCPYAVVSVEVDVDAVANAYFKNIITEKEYVSVLRKQVETFQFRPSEA